MVIGGGAAGFFAAIQCKENYPDAEVILLEKSNKILSKVKVSGGGRCNVTSATFSIAQLVKNYPRGGKFLKKLFPVFSTQDTIDWFRKHQVELVAEDDKRMFPVSNTSMTIVDCLLNTARRLGVEIRKNAGVEQLTPLKHGFHAMVDGTELFADKVIVATGGSNKMKAYSWLVDLGHTIEEPIPSLFTFNMPSEEVKELPGVVVKNVQAKVLGTKLKSEGDLLVTHWGMSGPAILRLSAWGAKELFHMNYRFVVSINWLSQSSEEEVRALFPIVSGKKVVNENPFHFPKRFWIFLLKKVGIGEEVTWDALSKKSKNKLVNVLTNDQYNVEGKTTFKEEFVTCGGVSLEDVHVKTMQSKKCPGLYFCGEVLDVDGITGGFNFQAAWSTGFLAGQLKE